jgi:hypothetical protein
MDAITVGLVNDKDDSEFPFYKMDVKLRPQYKDIIVLSKSEWAGRWEVKHMELLIPAVGGVDMLVYVEEKGLL